MLEHGIYRVHIVSESESMMEEKSDYMKLSLTIKH